MHIEGRIIFGRNKGIVASRTTHMFGFLHKIEISCFWYFECCKVEKIMPNNFGMILQL